MISYEDLTAMGYYEHLEKLDFDSYQVKTADTAVYPKEFGLYYVTLGLSNEAGEFAGKVKKIIRDGDYDTEALAAELGDVLWYLARCADELGIPLRKVAEDNLTKLQDRKNRNVIKGSGDGR